MFAGKGIRDLFGILLLLMIIALFGIPLIPMSVFSNQDKEYLLFDGDSILAIVWCILYYALILVFVWKLIPFHNIWKLIQFKYNRRAVGFRYGMKQIMKQHFGSLFRNLVMWLVLFLCTILIVVTLVKLFDFIKDLGNHARKTGKRLTLLVALKIAGKNIAEIPSDLWKVFSLFVVWETYTFAVATTVFGLLLPAIGFVEIIKMVCNCGEGTRVLRFTMGIVLWFGLLTGVFMVSGPGKVENVKEIWPFCVVTALVCAGYFIATFGCIRRNEAPIELDQREHRSKRQHGLEYAYGADRVCKTCGATCSRSKEGEGPGLLDRNNLEDEQMEEHSCQLCGVYLWKGHDYSYRCGTCQHVWCIPCGNKVLGKGNRASEPGAQGKEKNMAAVLWTFPNDEFIGKWIRPKWTNIIQFIAVALDWLLMVCYVLTLC